MIHYSAISKWMLLQITNPSVSMMSLAQVELDNDLVQFLDGMLGCYSEYISHDSVSTRRAGKEIKTARNRQESQKEETVEK